MPHDLDTGALLAAAKEQGQWLTSGGSESRARYVLGDKLGGLWPQALRALALVLEAPYYPGEDVETVLLAAQERLLGKEE